MPLDVEKLSDAELRSELNSRGVNAGPVTGTTRTLYEKKLKNLLSGKTKSKEPVPVPSKPVTTPQRGRPSKNSTFSERISTTRRSNRSEVEEESDEDEPVISPSREKVALKKPVTSTPEPDEDTDLTHNTTARSSNGRTKYPESNSIRSRYQGNATGDRPGGTPPRNKTSSFKPLDNSTFSGISKGVKPGSGTTVHKSSMTSVTSPKYSSLNSSIKSSLGRGMHTLKDLGATTGEDDDDEDGVETSRIIYTSSNDKYTSNRKKGLVGRAWDKVQGYDFKTASTPGENYDFRAGGTRTRVVKDPKTGKYIVEQSKSFMFSDALRICFVALCVLFVGLSLVYVVSNQRNTVSSGITAVTAATRDTLNFVYRYAVIPVVATLGVALLGVGSYFGYKKYKEAKEQEEQQDIELIEKILGLIRQSYEDGESYVSQPHIRDVIFPPSRRRKAELARWERAVAFIDAHESRVETEVSVLPSGNECAVWKWIGFGQTRRY